MEQLLSIIESGVKLLDETLRKHLISKFWGDDPTHYDFDNYLHI